MFKETGYAILTSILFLLFLIILVKYDNYLFISTGIIN